MEGRTNDEPVAATRIVTGTDVDYGSLTNHLVDHQDALHGLFTI
jgi:malate dehydrogenase (quinone)